MNYDPSHLWWQGVDPLAFIAEARDWIGTVHVKDAFFDERDVAVHGVVSAEDFDHWDKRPWAFSTLGTGHSEQFWSQFVIALRKAGYDRELSIECEDPFMSPDDTLERSVAVLRRVLPVHAAPRVDWGTVAIGP